MDGGTGPDASARDGGPSDVEPPGGCTGDPEWCDGYDNDCDGRVDNGEVCADGSIAHTQPYAGGAWLLVVPTSERGSCNTNAMPLWPVPHPEGLVELDLTDAVEACAPPVQFGPDGQAHGWLDGGGIFRLSGAAEMLATPPCFDRVEPGFGFDETGRLYYRCGSTLRRGNGEAMVDDFDGRIRAVLPSGRTVTQAPTDPAGHLVLRRADGSTSSRDPTDGWVGTMEPEAVVVAGEAAYATYVRTYRGGTRTEAAILRVDGATGRWDKVRRAPIHAGRGSVVGLPDGTVLQLRQASSSGGSDRYVVEHPPGGPAHVFWHEEDSIPLSTVFRVFAGPRAAGP